MKLPKKREQGVKAAVIQAPEAERLYDSLFEWQTPLSLWERSENLRDILNEDQLAGRAVGRMDTKRILEGWVMGKTLSLEYHGKECLVKVAQAASMDGQVYCDQKLMSVEVTQALIPGSRHSLFGKPYASMQPFAPINFHERNAFRLYCDRFIDQAFQRIEQRIEHKFQLYKTLDFLLVYVDLFDMQHPRFSYFALRELYEEHEERLQSRLRFLFNSRWHTKINHLFLLDDKPRHCMTHFTPAGFHVETSLA